MVYQDIDLVFCGGAQNLFPKGVPTPYMDAVGGMIFGSRADFSNQLVKPALLDKTLLYSKEGCDRVFLCSVLDISDSISKYLDAVAFLIFQIMSFS